jgi:signal transduction histidine kinase
VKSLTSKVLMWCLGTLAFSWVGLVVVSRVISRNILRPANAAETPAGTLDSAIHAYESGGAAALDERLTSRRALFGKYSLLDEQGRDLVTRDNRAALIAGMRPDQSRAIPGRGIVIYAAGNGRYSLVWVGEWMNMPNALISIRTLLLYYLPVLVAVAALFWLLAWNIASPIRRLAKTVDRFGSGELSVRTGSRRRDEIGNLSRTFDRMAERISTLLTAERRLLQDISHELRSPLARLEFAAELVRTAEDRDAAVGRLRKEISRLNNLVNELIQVTRAEGDPSQYQAEEIRFDEIVLEVIEDYRNTRRCEIAADAGKPVVVRGDRELLRRSIENILQNGLRYSPEGAPLEVKLETAGDTVRLTIRDYGPGVPHDALTKIFQPFFRVDDSRDKTTGGVGLGLAITGRAVALHHGRLSAENANPGLRVTMEIPIA